MEKITLAELFEIDNGSTRYIIFSKVGKEELYRVNPSFQAKFSTYFKDFHPELLERKIYSFSVSHDPYGVCVTLAIGE